MEKVIRKLTVSGSLLKELKEDARYEIVSENRRDPLVDSIDVELYYDGGEILGGARKQELTDRVEITAPEAIVKRYMRQGYTVVSLSPNGKNVTAILER